MCQNTLGLSISEALPQMNEVIGGRDGTARDIRLHPAIPISPPSLLLSPLLLLQVWAPHETGEVKMLTDPLCCQNRVSTVAAYCRLSHWWRQEQAEPVSLQRITPSYPQAPRSWGH